MSNYSLMQSAYLTGAVDNVAFAMFLMVVLWLREEYVKEDRRLEIDLKVLWDLLTTVLSF